MYRDNRLNNQATNIETEKKTKRLWLKIFLFGMLLIILVAIPWPADNSSYINSTYQKNTLDRLASTNIEITKKGPFLTGFAETDITPPPGHPLAGFASRRPKAYDDIHSRCYGKALTIARDSQMVTILTADILIFHKTTIESILKKTGLRSQDIYFTTTHTHAGPGGYINGILKEIIMGKYNDEYFEKLTSRLSNAVLQSRKNLRQTESGFINVDASDLLENRIDKRGKAFGKLSAIVFQEINTRKTIAALICFSAHPTILREWTHALSSEYPGILSDAIKQRTQAEIVLFAAGAVGDSESNLKNPVDLIMRAEVYGRLLADKLLNNWDRLSFQKNPSLANIQLDADLGQVRVCVGPKLRVNPLLTNWLTDRKARLHMLRIGKVVLAGFPSDYCGDLAFKLDLWTKERGLELMPTSFNGDWKGYAATSETFFSHGGYETRDMNFFGPYWGEYLNDLVKQMVERTENSQTVSQWNK
jgi:hypothetical protein